MRILRLMTIGARPEYFYQKIFVHVKVHKIRLLFGEDIMYTQTIYLFNIIFCMT